MTGTQDVLVPSGSHTDSGDARTDGEGHGGAADSTDPPTAGGTGTGWWNQRVVAIALPVVLVLVAGALRLARLGTPTRLYFDEKYYANDAHEYLLRGVEDVRAVHPPLGKWLIAAGIEVVGFTPVGWRISAALAGTVTVLLVYLAARRLCDARWAAGLAALLYAVDGLAFTMSRIAMLDVFSAMFVALAFWLLLVHRDVRAAGGSGRRWLLLVGVALGGALAVKWTGLAVIAAAGVFVVAGEIMWGRREGRAWWRSTARVAPLLAVCFLLVPATLYMASYAGWFSNVEHTEPGRRLCPQEGCPEGISEIVDAWRGEQADIARFHRNLVPNHPYRSSPLGWPLLQRPVLYFFERCEPSEGKAPEECLVSPGSRAKILGLGNPAVWWPALAAYPALAWFAARRRDWRAGALLLFLAAQYVPLILTGRTGYLFYMTPIVAFMCLSLAVVVERAATLRPLRWLPAALAVVAVAAFVYFYPVYAAVEDDPASIDQRLWLESWR